MSEYVDIAPRPVRFYRVIVGEWEYTYEITPEMTWIRIDINAEAEGELPTIRAVVWIGEKEHVIPWKTRILAEGRKP